MRLSRLTFIAIVVVITAMVGACTELNPTFDPNKTGPKLDTLPGQLDGAVPWKDHQVPDDQWKPTVDSDPSCPPGMNRCGGKCVDLRNDSNHCGKCGQPCTGGTVCKSGSCCPPSMTNCGGLCADLFSDAKHCGKCNQSCGKDEECVGSMCCGTGQANCNGKCTKVESDVNNCGSCGNKCPANEKCEKGKCAGGGPVGSACADGSDDQKFSKGMVGCKGRVRFDQRNGQCAKGFRPCKAAEWVANRGNSKPNNHYWTNDNLRYNGSGSGACWVSTTTGKTCSGGVEPMRVCAGKIDSMWNYCNWTNCGYGTATPDHYFGGCQGNRTAGVLCCPN